MSLKYYKIRLYLFKIEKRNIHLPCCSITIFWILSSFIIGLYFFYFWFSTFEFSKCSINWFNPWSLAYVSAQIFNYNLCYLLAFVLLPNIFVIFIVECQQVLRIYEVYKSIANITLVLNYYVVTFGSQGKYKKS